MKKLLLLIFAALFIFTTPSSVSAQGNATCDQAGEPCCGSRTGGACLIGTGLVCVAGTCRDPNALPDTTQCDQSGEACCTDPVSGTGFCTNGLPCLSGTCQIAPPAGPPQNGPWYNQTPGQFQDKVFGGNPDEIFGERYTFAQVNWIVNSLYLMLTIPTDSATLRGLIDALKTFLQSNAAPSFRDYAQLGLPGLLIGGISEVYSNPVASGTQAISQVFDKFDPTPKAYAQGGYGYGATGGIRALWTASRNMAYLIMIILLIASGFMIMFRVKINPQTAVTLQLMIPKIIITLLLVTFSYAIAGLVIDLVYVLLAFILSLASTNNVFDAPVANVISWNTKPDYFRVVLYFLIPTVLVILEGIVGAAACALFGFIPFAGAVLGPIVTGAGTLWAILGIIMLIFLAWLLFKIWWMLVKTYIQLILYIIIGPWQIMLGLLPGQGGFGSWLRNMVAHASVFLVVPLMFFFNMVIWDQPLSVILSLTGWNPLGTVNRGTGAFPDFPLFGSKGTIFNLAIGYAILALTPKIAEIIRDALKVPPFKYGTAFGEALGPAKSVGLWPARSAIGYQAAINEDIAKTGLSRTERATGSAFAEFLRNTQKKLS